MRRTAFWMAVALGGCGEDPGPTPDPGSAQEEEGEPGPPLAGCVGVTIHAWSPSRGGDAYTETHTYDDQGWLVDRLVDLDGPGTDWRETWARRPDGTYTEWAVDDGDDGVVDERETYTWDGDDLVSREYDWDGDGRVDERSEYVSEGGQLREERYDWDADGSPESLFVWTYDGGDRVSRITRDDFLNEVLDWEALYEWDGDLLMRYQADEGVDGGVEQISTYTYDDAGRLAKWNEIDRFQIDDTRVWTYVYVDDDDLADQGSRISNSQGAFFQGASWGTLRDERGREIQEIWSYDDTGDEEADRTLTSITTWTCP